MSPPQVYCSSLSVCIPSQCHSPSLAPGSCPTGHLQCDGQSCIQNQCLALVLTKASQRLLEDEQDNEVGEGEGEDQPGTRVKRQEGPRKEFPQEKEEEEEEEEDGNYISCPRGTAFCLETLRCAPTCSDGLGQLSDDDGDIFELEDEEEEDEDDEEDDDEDDGRYLTCPPGTIFCMSEMSCQPACGGDRDQPDHFMEEEEERKEMVCPAGQVFCMKVMACVSNCDFFDHKKRPEEEKEGGGGGGNNINIEVGCPEGKVSLDLT